LPLGEAVVILAGLATLATVGMFLWALGIAWWLAFAVAAALGVFAYARS